MGNNRKRPLVAEINMVPFIDIMLALLIVFMVSAQVALQGMEVQLPKVSTGEVTVKPSIDTLVLAVDSQERYFINIGDKQEQANTLKDLGTQVKKVVSIKPDIKVLIKGDERVKYGAVITVMAHLQSIGVSNVGLITEPIEPLRN